MDYGLHGTCMPLLAIVSRESSRSLAQDGVWLYLVLVRPGYMIVIRTSTDGVFKRIMNCSDPFFFSRLNSNASQTLEQDYLQSHESGERPQSTHTSPVAEKELRLKREHGICPSMKYHQEN